MQFSGYNDLQGLDIDSRLKHPRVYLSGIHAKQNHNGQRLTDKGECL
jgi:hypothetical protein